MTSLLKKAGLIFDENKVKPYLKMSIQRLQLLINKKTNQVKSGKKEIARLLAEGKEEKARIRVEQVIREDQTAEAYDILELHCELIAGRVRFLASQKECPLDMEQAVCTLIWAADRAEVAELSTVKDQFTKKYGGEYVKRAEVNEGGCVNHKVVEKLACDPPAGYAITAYLVKIAEEYEVEYEPAIVPPIPEPRASGALNAPQPAHEAPLPRRSYASSAAPSVSAWAVANDSIPCAEPTVDPMPGVAYAGGGGAVSPDRGVPGAHPAGQPWQMQGHYVEPAPGVAPPDTRGGGGGDESAKTWVTGPGSPVAGHPPRGHGGPHPNDPPPPYSRYDIPSPPSTRPAKPAATLDIPAAPGYEDPPPATNPSADAPFAAPAPESNNPPASSQGGSDMDDIAARLERLPGSIRFSEPPEGESNMDDFAARLRNLHK